MKSKDERILMRELAGSPEGWCPSPAHLRAASRGLQGSYVGTGRLQGSGTVRAGQVVVWCSAPEPSGAGTSAGLGGKWGCLGLSLSPVEPWAPSSSTQGTPHWTVLSDPGLP